MLVNASTNVLKLLIFFLTHINFFRRVAGSNPGPLTGLMLKSISRICDGLEERALAKQAAPASVMLQCVILQGKGAHIH